MTRRILSLRELFRRIPAEGETRHLLRSFNLGMASGSGVPSAKKLAVALGFDVCLLEMPKGIRGRLVADSFAENGFCIEVNAHDDVVTQRWTVLHEIMHFLLHYRDDPLASPQHRAGKSHFYEAGELREEREANAFVESLVFGDGALEAAVALHGQDSEFLARRFGVSEATVKIALRAL